MAGTRWVRLDVDYFENPKTLGVGRAGRELHLRSICWAQRYLTDGELPAAAVVELTRHAGLSPARRAAVEELLVTHRLWIPTENGYELHDFVSMNGTRAQAEAERAGWRNRQRASRAARGGNGDVTA